MTRLRPMLTPAVLTVLVIASSAVLANENDLDVTMTVLDDLSDIEDLTTAPPATSRYELDQATDDQEEPRSILDQFQAMDGEFQIDDDNDGFEFEDEAEMSWRDFETEADFEEGEDIEQDEFDEEPLP